LHAHRRTAHIAHSLSYKAMADDIADLIQWPVVLDKLNRLLTQYYDWSNEVTKIRTPTLLVFGHADAVRPAHVVEFSGLLGGRKRDGGWDGSGISNACDLTGRDALQHFLIACEDKGRGAIPRCRGGYHELIVGCGKLAG
jgi:hypothetical protein